MEMAAYRVYATAPSEASHSRRRVSSIVDSRTRCRLSAARESWIGSDKTTPRPPAAPAGSRAHHANVPPSSGTRALASGTDLTPPHGSIDRELLDDRASGAVRAQSAVRAEQRHESVLVCGEPVAVARARIPKVMEPPVGVSLDYRGVDVALAAHGRRVAQHGCRRLDRFARLCL